MRTKATPAPSATSTVSATPASTPRRVRAITSSSVARSGTIVPVEARPRSGHGVPGSRGVPTEASGWPRMPPVTVPRAVGWSGDRTRPPLHPDRLHRRVGNPQGRRQGEGPAGRGSAGDQLRRRRAGFPTPGHIVEAAPCDARPEELPVHARGGPPRAARGDRREDPARQRARGAAGQVIVTNGGKQAVYQAFQTLLDPGDEVLVPTPYWTTYPEAIKLAGGVQVDVFAGADQGYLVTVEQLEAARTERTKVLLFVSPSNPTGAVYSPEQTRPSASGRSSTASGWSATRSTRTSPIRRGRRVARARSRSSRPCPGSRTRRSSSTASPRPTP